MKDKVQKIYEYLKNHDIYAEVWEDKNLSCVIYIRIDGDWKHDHQYCTYLMKEYGYSTLGEKDIEDNGDDWYESTHIFVGMA